MTRISDLTDREVWLLLLKMRVRRAMAAAARRRVSARYRQQKRRQAAKIALEAVEYVTHHQENLRPPERDAEPRSASVTITLTTISARPMRAGPDGYQGHHPEHHPDRHTGPSQGLAPVPSLTGPDED